MSASLLLFALLLTALTYLAGAFTIFAGAEWGKPGAWLVLGAAVFFGVFAVFAAFLGRHVRRGGVLAVTTATPQQRMRDMFAMSALEGMLSSSEITDRGNVDKQVWTAQAYEWADHMMKMREMSTENRQLILSTRGIRT